MQDEQTRLSLLHGPRGFPTELTPRGKPSCIVRVRHYSEREFSTQVVLVEDQQTGMLVCYASWYAKNLPINGHLGRISNFYCNITQSVNGITGCHPESYWTNFLFVAGFLSIN